MKKIYWVAVVVGLLLVIGIYIWYDNYYRCSFGHTDRCDLSCEVDDECKLSNFICVNEDDDMSVIKKAYRLSS